MRDGTDPERDLPPFEAIKAYPMAIFWAVLVSMTVIMEGYDTILIGNFFAFPTFQQKYGTYFPDIDRFQLTAPWQAALGNSAGVGAFCGVLLNGYLVGIFGQKRVLLASLLVLSAFIVVTFFAPNIIVLMVGELLCGFPWGVFATIAPAYASEVLPDSLRVYLTSYTNMVRYQASIWNQHADLFKCFIIGQLIAAGVLDGLIHNPTQWSYRIPFALQWVWPAFLFPILCFAPESPWHLVRKGRLEEAEASLKRLVRSSANIETKATLAAIVRTNNLEEDLATGTAYWDCFKGSELRRTEIACVVFAGQILAGTNFAYNSTYFFEQVGLSTEVTYGLNVGGTAMALFATLLSWFFLMPYFGRRTIYLYGMMSMALVLILIGILNVKASATGVGMAQAGLTLFWTFLFQLSVGQLGWAIPAEMGSTRLRQKTICLARNFYYIVGVVANILEAYFMNPTQWDLKGYTGFVWGGTALCTFIWAFFRLPESRGRTYEELDILFAKQVPARKFKNYKISSFEKHEPMDEALQGSAV